MLIAYNIETKEIVDYRAGESIPCPKGCAVAHAEWPSYAQKGRVKLVIENKAEIEITQWLLSLDQLKAEKIRLLEQELEHVSQGKGTSMLSDVKSIMEQMDTSQLPNRMKKYLTKKTMIQAATTEKDLLEITTEL